MENRDDAEELKSSFLSGAQLLFQMNFGIDVC